MKTICFMPNTAFRNGEEPETFNGELNPDVLKIWGFDRLFERIDLRDRSLKTIKPDTFRIFTNLKELCKGNL
jgi:hypothetical protein